MSTYNVMRLTRTNLCRFYRHDDVHNNDNIVTYRRIKIVCKKENLTRLLAEELPTCVVFEE